MTIKIDAEKFALAVISSVPAIGDSPEAIAQEKIELYVAAYEAAVKLDKSNGKHYIEPTFLGSKRK